MVLEKSSSTTMRTRDTKERSIFHLLQACSIAASAACNALNRAGQDSVNSAGSGGFFTMTLPSRVLMVAVALAASLAVQPAAAEAAIGQVKTRTGEVKVLRHG